MLIAEAHVRTDRPSQYLTQLCKQANTKDGHRLRPHHKGKARTGTQYVEWSDTHGTIAVGRGRCTLQVEPDSLTLRIEATDQDNLQRIQHLIAGRLRQISEDDAPQVVWQQAEASDHQPGTPATAVPAPPEKTTSRSRRGVKHGLVALVVLVVAVHLLLGEHLASGPSTHWIIGIVLAAILAHVVFFLIFFAVRRRRALSRCACEGRSHVVGCARA